MKKDIVWLKKKRERDMDYYCRNKDKKAEYNKKYQPVYKQRRKERMGLGEKKILKEKQRNWGNVWRKRNLDKVKERSKEYYVKNKEIIKKRNREWQKKNYFRGKRKFSVVEGKRIYKEGEELIISSTWKENNHYMRSFFRVIRNGGICFVCGEIFPLVLINHHVFGKHRGFGISLCANCHTRLFTKAVGVDQMIKHCQIIGRQIMRGPFLNGGVKVYLEPYQIPISRFR